MDKNCDETSFSSTSPNLPSPILEAFLARSLALGALGLPTMRALVTSKTQAPRKQAVASQAKRRQLVQDEEALL